jgi:hypothetical protein
MNEPFWMTRTATTSRPLVGSSADGRRFVWAHGPSEVAASSTLIWKGWSLTAKNPTAEIPSTRLAGIAIVPRPGMIGPGETNSTSVSCRVSMRNFLFKSLI